MINVLEILVLLLNIEAVTNIISKSELLAPLRKGLFNLSNSRGIKFAGFVHDLMDCPYCTSVWVSAFYLMCLYISANFPAFLTIFSYFCLIIVFHRLANIIHHIIDRVDKNRL